MLNVTLFELVSGSSQICSRAISGLSSKCAHILQLIAKTVSPPD